MRRLNHYILHTSTIAVLTGGAFLASSGAAMAQSNLLTNGSLENTIGTFPIDGSLAESISSGGTAIPGWTVTSNEVAWEESGQSGINSEDGSFNVDLTGRCDLGRNCGSPGAYGALSQSISTQVGATYDLHFYGGNYSGNNAAPTIVASAGATSESFLVPSSTDPAGTWTAYDLFFVATGTTSLITFTGSGGAQDQTNFLGLDNASVQQVASPVPLPATAWLMLGGLGGLGVVTRKKRTSQSQILSAEIK